MGTPLGGGGAAPESTPLCRYIWTGMRVKPPSEAGSGFVNYLDVDKDKVTGESSDPRIVIQ